MISDISYLPSLGKSDHLVLIFKLFCYTENQISSFTKLNFFKENYEELSLSLGTIDWDSVPYGLDLSDSWGWSGGAMVLGKLPVPGRPTIWIAVGQGPTALAVSAGGGRLDIFTFFYPFSSLSPSLWETARYRLKYCLKGPLNPKQPSNQLSDSWDTFAENIIK